MVARFDFDRYMIRIINRVKFICLAYYLMEGTDLILFLWMNFLRGT